MPAAAFAAAMAALGPFEPAPHLALAVSGGPDSMLLAVLARDWARARGGRVDALIVDHRLRDGSAAEAAQVARRLAALAVPATVLVWLGPRPASGVQAAARAARYALLADWCRRHGALHLLTGHHADDQAETVLLRRERGSGPDGLAGMSARRPLPGVRLLRPLLGLRRAVIAEALAGRGVAAVSDPSNADPRFARVVARRRLACEPAPDLGRAAGATRALCAAAANRLLAACAEPHPAGHVRLAGSVWRTAEPALRHRALGRLLRWTGGGVHPPAETALAALDRAMAAARGHTLAGCRVLPRRDGWLFVREAGRQPPPVAVGEDGSCRWDRFALACAGGEAGWSLGALGRESWLGLPRAARAALPAAAGPALPALRREGRVEAVPHLGFASPAAARLRPVLALRPPLCLADPGFAVAEAPAVPISSLGDRVRRFRAEGNRAVMSDPLGTAQPSPGGSQPGGSGGEAAGIRVRTR